MFYSHERGVVLRRHHGQVHHPGQSTGAPNMTGEGEVTAEDIQNGKYRYDISFTTCSASHLVRFGIRLPGDDRHSRGHSET